MIVEYDLSFRKHAILAESHLVACHCRLLPPAIMHPACMINGGDDLEQLIPSWCILSKHTVRF